LPRNQEVRGFPPQRLSKRVSSSLKDNYQSAMITDFHILIPIAKAAEAAATDTASAGIAGMFGLNAKLFLAQLINFGIILLVLWKWVFPPVTKALEARSKKIEQALKDAEKVAQEKLSFESWKTEEISKIRTEASQIVNQAKTDAETVRAGLLAKAKLEQEKIVEQGREQLKAEQARGLAEARQELAGLVVAASQKILRGKLDEKTDKELIKEALKEIS
jgi:F-type H+-transporting ATPase subunit b